MPIDKTINQPDNSDSLGPKPPTNPVEFAGWVQLLRVTSKNPWVLPALLKNTRSVWRSVNVSILYWIFPLYGFEINNSFFTNHGN